MSYWLVKSEPHEYSIEDFSKDKRTWWEGVRNYQARNFLRSMRRGDQVLIYHSSCANVGIVGLGVVSREALPDKLQFDRQSEYFDEKSQLSAPRWFAPELTFNKKFSPLISLELIKSQPALKKMELVKRGSRLSVQPVTESEFKVIIMLSDNCKER